MSGPRRPSVQSIARCPSNLNLPPQYWSCGQKDGQMENEPTIEDMLKQLRAITSISNINSITLAEQNFIGSASKFKGLVTISNAFRSVFIDAVDILNGTSAQHATDASLSQRWHLTHTWLLPRLAQNFRWLCGAEQQAFAGYPYPAFAQVRNIFDSAIITSAVAQGFASFEDAEGIIVGVPFDAQKTKNKRKATERIIDRKMTGADSGLSSTTMSQLNKVDELFDLETHGQRLSAVESMAWMKRQEPLRILPHYDDTSFAPFMNRYVETIWMVHRLLPLMRPPSAPSSDPWNSSWCVLDKSLQRCAFALTAQFGKPIGSAIVEFVTTKFPFNARSTLPI